MASKRFNFAALIVLLTLALGCRNRPAQKKAEEGKTAADSEQPLAESTGAVKNSVAKTPTPSASPAAAPSCQEFLGRYACTALDVKDADKKDTDKYELRIRAATEDSKLLIVGLNDPSDDPDQKFFDWADVNALVVDNVSRSPQELSNYLKDIGANVLLDKGTLSVRLPKSALNEFELESTIAVGEDYIEDWRAKGFGDGPYVAIETPVTGFISNCSADALVGRLNLKDYPAFNPLTIKIREHYLEYTSASQSRINGVSFDKQLRCQKLPPLPARR